MEHHDDVLLELEDAKAVRASPFVGKPDCL